VCDQCIVFNKELFLDFGRKFVESHVAGRKPVMLLDGHGINIDINPNHQNGRSRTMARTWLCVSLSLRTVYYRSQLSLSHS